VIATKVIERSANDEETEDYNNENEMDEQVPEVFEYDFLNGKDFRR